MVATFGHVLYGWLRWTWGGYPITSPQAGYNLFSGPLPDVTLLAGVVMLWRRHNCHVRGCPFLHWRKHPVGDDVMLCRVHHPSGRCAGRRLLVALGLARVR